MAKTNNIASNFRQSKNAKGNDVILFDYKDSQDKVRTTTLLPKFTVDGEQFVVNKDNMQEAANALAAKYIKQQEVALEKEASMSEEAKAERVQKGKEAYAKHVGKTVEEVEAEKAARKEARRGKVKPNLFSAEDLAAFDLPQDTLSK